MAEIKVITRPARPADRNFILATWLRGQYYGNPGFKLVPQDEFFKSYTSVVERILYDPEIDITIASGNEDPNWIAGFAVRKQDALYWIHVKEDFRKKGIAKLLIGEIPISRIKALTKAGAAIARKKGLIFDLFT